MRFFFSMVSCFSRIGSSTNQSRTTVRKSLTPKSAKDVMFQDFEATVKRLKEFDLDAPLGNDIGAEGVAQNNKGRKK